MSLFFLSITLYLIAVIKHFIYIWIRRDLIFNTAFGVTLVGFIAHTLFLGSISMKTGHGPYTSPSEYLAFFSWTIVLIYFFIEIKFKVKDLGVFLIPLVLLLFIFSRYIPNERVNIGSEDIKFWFAIHKTLSFIGYSIFALTFSTAFMYLFQEKQLKSKRLGILYSKLPSLGLLDRINEKTITVGFPLFTFGFLSGALIANVQKGSYLSWDMRRTIPLLVTWFIYCLLFLGRIHFGWRGKRAAYLSIIGFLTIFIAFIIHIY